MIKIKIIAVGDLKEKYLKEAQYHFISKIQRKADIEVIEVKEEKMFSNAGEKDIENLKEKEGERIVKKIPERTRVVLLDIAGKETGSKDISRITKENAAYIIGGSYGAGKNVLQKCNEKISLSKMTYTHQLTRIILLEQIYQSLYQEDGYE
jgi:23S rRNA (pseudouridine1915-N3)-methyltransferase